MSAPVTVGVAGATGRMGLAILRALGEFPALRLGAALTRPGHAALGVDAGTQANVGPLGVPITADAAAAARCARVMIAFTRPDALAPLVAACAAARSAMVIGTTGYEAEARAAIEAAAREVPVVVAPNTSLALNVLLALVRQAAAALPPDYDIEIFETHHRHKLDAPSGTALALGAAAAQGRGEPPAAPQLTGSTPGPRPRGGIGYAVARGGDVVGEHEVRLLGAGEQLRLCHIATDRTIFARGALTAAAWVADRSPGLYSMGDVLSIGSTR